MAWQLDKLATEAKTAKVRRAAMDQLRRPIRTSGWIDRALMVCESFVMTPLALLHETRAIPKRQRARGQRRTTWKNRGE